MSRPAPDAALRVRPILILVWCLCLACLPAPARAWTVMDEAKGKLNSPEDCRAAVQRLSGKTLSADSNEFALLLTAHFMLARDASAPAERTKHWNAILDAEAGLLKRGELDIPSDFSNSVMLLLALQSAPEAPVAVYRENVRRRLAELAEKTTSGKNNPAYFTPHALHLNAETRLPAYASVVPQDLRQAYYNAAFEIFGDDTLTRPTKENIGGLLMAMLACIAEQPDERRPEMLDAICAWLERVRDGIAQADKYDREDLQRAVEADLGLMDLIRLLDGATTDFSLNPLLAQPDYYTRGGLVPPPDLALTPKGGKASPPDAKQAALIRSASGHFHKAYAGDGPGAHATLALHVRLHTLALARFPGDARLLAAYALSLSGAWNPDTQQYDRYSSSNMYEGLPKVSDLVQQAEATAPDDPAVIAARLKADYSSHSTVTGKALAKKLLLQFKQDCLDAEKTDSWDNWRKSLDLRSDADLNLTELFRDIDAFGKRCPSLAPFVKSRIAAKVFSNIIDEGKNKKHAGEQRAFLEQALVAPHPAHAEVIVAGLLAELAAPSPSWMDELSPKERQVRLTESLGFYKRAHAAWSGQADAFPQKRHYAEVLRAALQSADIPLTDELLDAARATIPYQYGEKVDDPTLAWAKALFSLADSRAMNSASERAALLRGKALDTYAAARTEAFTAADWVFWADMLRKQAEQEKRLNDPEYVRQIMDKLDRALAFAPLARDANEATGKLSLDLMAGTPEDDWQTLHEKAYGHFLVASGLDPASARAFLIWAQALHEAAGKEDSSPKNAMRLLAERFNSAGMATRTERIALVNALFPDKAWGVAPAPRPLGQPDRKQDSSRSASTHAYRAYILPKLIEADFADPDEFVQLQALAADTDDNRYYGGGRPDATPLFDTLLVLESFRLFPETLARMEATLFQQDLPRELRLQWLQSMGATLCEGAHGIYHGTDKGTACDRDNGVPQAMAVWYAPADPQNGDAFQEKRAAADLLLSSAIDFMEEESPLADIAARQKAGKATFVPWNKQAGTGGWDMRDGASALHSTNYGNLLARTGAALSSKLRDEVFFAKARALLLSDKNLPGTRLEAIRIIVASPSESLDGALAAAPYSQGLEYFSSFWNRIRHDFTYGVSPGNCGDALADVLQRNALRAHRIATGNQKGPGITLEKLKEPPVSFNGHGPLYILHAGAGALPKYLLPLTENDLSPLSGTLLVAMNGPRLTPVQPDTASGALLLNWAVTVGAPRNMAVIIASDDAPEMLAKRLAAWHLSLWEEPDGLSFVFNKPCAGSFLRAYLPQVKGEAASLFMGKEKAIWFATPALGGVTWYRAAPDQGLRPLDGARLPCILEISRPQLKQGDTTFTEDVKFHHVNEFAYEYPKPGRDPAFALRFFEKQMKELAENPATKSMTPSERRRATRVLWRALGSPQEKEVRRIMFAKEEQSPNTRINNAQNPLEKQPY